MAGTFPLIEARQELGVIPTTAVRARAGMRTDTAAGAVGATTGRALLGILEQAGERRKEKSIRRKAIERKRRQMMDDNMSVIAKQMRDTATITFNTFKRTNSQETWEPERIRQTQEIADAIAQLDFSPDALVVENLKSNAYSGVESAQAFDDSTRRLIEDTIEAQSKAMVDAFRTGGAREQLDAVTRYRDNGDNMGKDKVEVLNDIKAARTAGKKLRKQDTIDTWQDRIAENPVETENILEVELELRKEKGITKLSAEKEIAFQEEFANIAKTLGISDNPDDPRHFYDYRALFKETGSLAVGPGKHFPSKFKLLGHPNLIVNGKDTRTGAIASKKLIEQNKIARQAVETGQRIPENVLASADIQSLINLANAREVQLLADTLAERNRQQRDLENELYDGLADKSKSISDVMDSNADAGVKRRLVNDEENFARRDVNKTWPLVDNDVTVQRLDSQLSSLEAGVIDRTQMNQQINTATVDGGLTKETRNKFRVLSKNGGRDAIDVAVKFEVDKIENALIRRFTDRETRFALRSLERPLTQQEQRESSSNAYMLQINRHQLLLIKGEIERNMRPPITDKDVVSGIEATVIAAKVWETYRVKTLGEKINDFKEYKGQRVPIPDGFSQNVWDAASDREKADIQEAASNGLSNAEILKMIGR